MCVDPLACTATYRRSRPNAVMIPAYCSAVAGHGERCDRHVCNGFDVESCAENLRNNTYSKPERLGAQLRLRSREKLKLPPPPMRSAGALLVMAGLKVFHVLTGRS